MTELVWEGKYDQDGRRVAPLRVALAFQEARKDRRRRAHDQDRRSTRRAQESRRDSCGQEGIDHV